MPWFGDRTGLFEQTITAIADAVGDGRLPMERLADAVARTQALSSRFPAAGAAEIQEAAIRGQLGLPGQPQLSGVPAEPKALDGERIAEAFEVSEAAERWLAREEPVAIVQVETGSNFAVGRVPWAPLPQLRQWSAKARCPTARGSPSSGAAWMPNTRCGPSSPA